MDFKRAFETINRNKLLIKLSKYGINGNELNWFDEYLRNRQQRTLFQGSTSPNIFNDHGVPQGSVLGAILFIIYINDIKKALKYCDIKLFADDTLIYIHGKDINILTERINEDLAQIEIWMNENDLKLNTTKTKVMIIGNNIINDDIKINNTILEIVNEYKYLGVIIDNKLKFDKYARYICNKMAQKTNILARIQNKLNYINKIQIYKSIIAPYIEFCSSILFMCNDTDIERIQKIQNRAMRIILKMPKTTPINIMLNMLQWLNVRERIMLKILIFIHKIIQEKTPSYLSENIERNTERTNYRLRNFDQLTHLMGNKEKTRNSIFIKGIVHYNRLPREVRMSNNMIQFRKGCVIEIKNKKIY